MSERQNGHKADDGRIVAPPLSRMPNRRFTLCLKTPLPRMCDHTSGNASSLNQSAARLLETLTLKRRGKASPTFR